jgi:hypothetical protein
VEVFVGLIVAFVALAVVQGVRRANERQLATALSKGGWVADEVGGWTWQDRVRLTRDTAALNWWSARARLTGFGARGRIQVFTRHAGKARKEIEADHGLIVTPLGRQDLDPRVVVLCDAPDFVRGLLTSAPVVEALKPVLSLGEHVNIDAEGTDTLRVRVSTNDARVIAMGDSILRLADAIHECRDAKPVPLDTSLGVRALSGASSAGSPVAISTRKR